MRPDFAAATDLKCDDPVEHADDPEYPVRVDGGYAEPAAPGVAILQTTQLPVKGVES